MSANDYIASLRDLLGMYTRKYTSCSSSHWSLFFLSRMLLEICTACFKYERETELMTSKTCLRRNSKINVGQNLKVLLSKVHSRNQQLEMWGCFVEEELSVTNCSCGCCNNLHRSQILSTACFSILRLKEVNSRSYPQLRENSACTLSAPSQERMNIKLQKSTEIISLAEITGPIGSKIYHKEQKVD